MYDYIIEVSKRGVLSDLYDIKELRSVFGDLEEKEILIPRQTRKNGSETYMARMERLPIKKIKKLRKSFSLRDLDIRIFKLQEVVKSKPF